jgi:hypothetical protein
MGLGQHPDSVRVQGTVLDDETGQPVPGALVYLDRGQRVRADLGGRFDFASLPPDRYGIAAVGPGCSTAVGVIEPRAGETLTVNLRIVALSGASTEVPRRGWEPAPEMAGARLEVITARDIQESNATTLMGLLRSRAPGMVGGPSGRSGDVSRLTGRGNNTATGSRQPIVIVDGARIRNMAEEFLSQMGLNQIARIEIYRGAAGAWIHGAESANGVIRIFTRSSGMGVDLHLDPEECGSPFRGAG